MYGCAGKTDLWSCTPFQSVVQRVLLTNESAITCLSSACASALFVSVIWPRQRATQSLQYSIMLLSAGEEDEVGRRRT